MTWMSNTKFYTDSIKVCHLASANMKGWTYVRMYMYSIQTIFSEPKFFASIDYHIFLPLVLRCACSAKIHVKCKHDIQDCIIIQVYITIQPTTWVGPYMYALSGALCDLKTQLVSCFYSQSVFAIAVCLLASSIRTAFLPYLRGGKCGGAAKSLTPVIFFIIKLHLVSTS